MLTRKEMGRSGTKSIRRHKTRAAICCLGEAVQPRREGGVQTVLSWGQWRWPFRTSAGLPVPLTCPLFFPKSKYRLAAWLVIARSQYQGLHSQLWGASRFSEWERALELFWVSVFLGWPDGK